MPTGHVKVYEDKRKGGLPVWAWLLPLLLLLLLLAWFLLHHRAPASQGVAAAPPSLGTVHFATNQSTLTSEGKATLQQAADYMKQHPDEHLRIEGFTSSTGSDPHNLTLSQQRAQTVQQYLQAQGIDASRLTGQGFGPSNPVAPNSDEAGRADNRRAELFTQH